MQAGVSSVTEKATSLEKGESTCPSWLLAGTSAILSPAASKIVMLNCASKATMRPLTVTGLVTESPVWGESTLTTSAEAGSGLVSQTFGWLVGVGDSSAGPGETVAPGVMSTPSPFLQASTRATAQVAARSSTYFISSPTYGETPAQGKGYQRPVSIQRCRPSVLTDMSPSRSVRKTASPSRRAITSPEGWPKELCAPTEMTSTSGSTAARNAGELDVLEPW